MSKQNINNVITMVNIPEGTLTESFKKFIAKDNSIENILKFLSIQNARYIAKSGGSNEFSKEEKEELYEFYSYFMENYGAQTRDARYDNWGDEAFILVLADTLYQEDCERANEEFIKNVSEDVLKEAENLTEKMFAIRKGKHFSCYANNDMWTFSLRKGIPKKFLQSIKRETTVYFAKIIVMEGAIVIRIFNDDKGPDQIFGIRGTKTSWIPIPKDEMKAADLESQGQNDIHEILEYIEFEK